MKDLSLESQFEVSRYEAITLPSMNSEMLYLEIIKYGKRLFENCKRLHEATGINQGNLRAYSNAMFEVDSPRTELMEIAIRVYTEYLRSLQQLSNLTTTKKGAK